MKKVGRKAKSRDKNIQVVIFGPDWLHDDHGHFVFERVVGNFSDGSYHQKMTHTVRESVVVRWEETCAKRQAMYDELEVFFDIAVAREEWPDD